MHSIWSVFRAAMVIMVSFLWIRCGDDDDIEMVDCNQTIINIAITEKTDASGCNETDGSFVVAIDGGSEPYQFFVNNTSNANENFVSLPAGIHLINVTDNNGCASFQEIEIKATGSTLDVIRHVTPNTGCSISNGAI